MNDAVVRMLDSLGVPKENIAFDDFGYNKYERPLGAAFIIN